MNLNFILQKYQLKQLTVYTYLYSNLVNGTKKNQNISETFFDPSTDKLILTNDGRVIVKTTGCNLSLIIAGTFENLVFGYKK